MKLNELLKNITPAEIIGDAGAEITGVNIDSRRVAPGNLFIAMRGTQTDGHTFIPKAVAAGAGAPDVGRRPGERQRQWKINRKQHMQHNSSCGN